MHSALLWTLAALPNLVVSHGNGFAGLPKLMGGAKLMADLKTRNMFDVSEVKHMATAVKDKFLHPRVAETCGPGVGNCDAGYCCSGAGYCGKGKDYCAAPDCLYKYGPACDANTVPPGASTSGIARPKVGSIPYGGSSFNGIQDCIKDGVIAFTFDDGPYLYTKDLLDLLERYNAKATFFITGNNLGKGEIDSCATGYPQLIKRMYDSGHQIASHTWSHQNLSSLTATDFNNQMYYNEMAIRNIIGQIPTYMRPPYSECTQTCSTRLSNMGYHATYFDLDTEGYLHTEASEIQISKNIFDQSLREYGSNPATSNFLLIEHDIHYQVVYNLTEYMLKQMVAKGYGAPVTVGTCLNDPPANWYRAAPPASTLSCLSGGGSTAPTAAATSSAKASTTTSKAATTSTTTSKASTTTTKASSTTTSRVATGTSLAISTDGTCGNGKTCQGSSCGNCCSTSGWCGSTAAYCGGGCQPSFGTCSASTVGGKTISTDGTCGGTKGMTCSTSSYGNCCSSAGWCGSTAAHCGSECQGSFGTCT